MVQSWPHHLRHQWSQISKFVSLNHLRHHTYSKSSYVHIQVFHILHHHTMKLLLGIKSFLPRRPIVEIGSENWFAVGCPIRQRKLVRCRLPIQQRKLFRSWRHNFSSKDWFAAANMFCGSECYFATDNSISTASHKFAANNTTSAATTNPLQNTELRQRITISLQDTQFGSEC
jgi:hypothetical protein